MTFFFLFRREDYTLDFHQVTQPCSNIQVNIFNSVKHVTIDGRPIYNNAAHYSFSNDLNRIIPLKQLTKLVVYYSDFELPQLIDILQCTPNLETIICYARSLLGKVDLELIQQTNSFQYASTTNNVKSLDIHLDKCTLERFQMILNLFPQLEFLRTEIEENEMEKFSHLLPLKVNGKIHPLCVLCAVQLSKNLY